MKLLLGMILAFMAASPMAGEMNRDMNREKTLEKKYSVTVSPLLVIPGLVDLSVEYRPVPKWGYVANTMFGEFNLDRYKGQTSDDGTLRVGQAQVRRYLNTGGTHFAGELSYWRIDSDAASSGGFEGRLQQWRAGALIGYKRVSRIGLTLDFQGGVYWAILNSRTGVESGLGDPPPVGPIVRANVGWSF